MRGNKELEEIAGRETGTIAIPNDDGVAGQEQGGAKPALHRDIEALLPNLRRYALSLTHDVTAADDLVQECVARALAKLHLWTAGTDLRAWLFMILHNQYISQVRRAARDGKTVEWSECKPALTCLPQQIEYLEVRELERAITLLPEEQRIAVLRVGLTRESYDEIASACDVPVGTIRSRLSRGRSTLRKLTGIDPSQASAKTPTEANCQI